jgi:hypothetical protein
MFDYMDAGKMEGVTYRLMCFTQQQVANVSTEEQARELESGRNLALRSEVCSLLMSLHFFKEQEYVML